MTIRRPQNVTTRALVECAQWLSYCIGIGWDKSSLDFLEQLWWDYHDRTGRLRLP